MIAHVWSVLCRRAVVDRESNNISLHDIVEQLNVPLAPQSDAVLGIELCIASLWARTDPEEPVVGRSRIIFSFPSGKLTNVGEETVIDLSEHARARSIMRLQGFPASEHGWCVFHVEIEGQGEGEWRRVADVPVQVVFQPPEAAQKGEEET